MNISAFYGIISMKKLVSFNDLSKNGTIAVKGQGKKNKLTFVICEFGVMVAQQSPKLFVVVRIH